ncbi:MAG: pseudouridine synthase [Treponemataceae bacterium]
MSGSNLLDNHQLTDETKPIRLQAFLAHAGVASRRASEKIILDGRVSVNGEVVNTLGTKVLPSDTVCVDGNSITTENTKRYVLLNKPIGYVCSLSDEQNRPLAIDLLKEHFSERLYNVGRLDMFSAGLIIFTNDGEFAKKISHPSFELEKEYFVETSLPYPPTMLEKFEKGIRIKDIFYKCKAARRLSSRKFFVTLVEGKNREIRKVLEHFDVRVKKLIRVRIGQINLTTNNATLAEGSFRELTSYEVATLLKEEN